MWLTTHAIQDVRSPPLAIGADSYPPCYTSARRPQAGGNVAAPVSTNQTWRFGVFEVDTRRVELRRDGTPVKIREQLFLILVYLLEHPGEIVTREELRRVLWPSGTFVDFDHSLNMAVMNLRDALGDSISTPHYIETIPKRGYRFIAPVTEVSEEQNGLTNSNGNSARGTLNGTGEAPQIVSAPAKTHIVFLWPVHTVAAIGFILLTGIGLTLLIRTRSIPQQAHNEDQAAPSFRIVPVTAAPGSTTSPAFSPNGAWIAYLWNGTEARRRICSIGGGRHAAPPDLQQERFSWRPRMVPRWTRDCVCPLRWEGRWSLSGVRSRRCRA
jgi:DNA-binding winged helix-turn-helix (wHTH) protein